MGDHYRAWRASKEGKIRAIGVYNFYPERLPDFCVNVKIILSVNQTECYSCFQRNKDMKTIKEYGVQMKAWGPLSKGQKNIFQNELPKKIDESQSKAVAQVFLHWHLLRIDPLCYDYH